MSGIASLEPYRGLRAFQDSDVDVPFFFGRERERRLIEANLMASRLTVLYGETGVGKSSVLRAGVAHHLRSTARANREARGEPELAVVVFDAWRDEPVEALRREVAREVTRSLGGTLEPVDEDVPLPEALRTWQQLLGGELYVVLDQAEEYFLYQRPEERFGRFALEFPAAVAAADLPVHFLLAIREDAVAKLDAFKTRIPNVLGNYLRLEHLDVEAAREAILGPVTRYNELVGEGDAVDLEPELVEAVLDQVAAGEVATARNGRAAHRTGDGSGRVETPYLQLVMQRLWDEERAAGSRTLRLETLRRLGGAGQIVGDHVARALAALTPAEKDLAAAMFDHLVTPSGGKIAHEVGDLAEYAAAEEPAVVSVLAKLGDDRIVRSVADGNGHGPRYEIFHDVLAEPVREWTTGHESERELARRHAAAERRHRRLLAVTAFAAVALAIMTGITVYALVQRGEARSQAQTAHARELAAQGTTQLQVEPQRSLALGIESAETKSTREAEDVLRQALIASRERLILPSRGPVRSAAFSPDSSLVLSGADDGTARLWRRDGTVHRLLRHNGPVTAASFSPDGRLVLTASRDGTARIWRTSSGDRVASLPHEGPVTSATFSRDGRLVVTTGEDGTARLWRSAGWTQLRAIRHGGPVTTASLSGDGTLLVTVASDRTGENRRARVFSLPGARLLHELGAVGVTIASFDPSGRLVVTGGLDHTAAVWDARQGKRLRVMADHQGAVTDALFGPGGRLLVTTSSDGATRVWDARTGTRVALMLGHANAVNDAAFGADGRFVITSSIDATARVWEASTGRLQVVLRGHGDAVLAGAFSADGRAVATASADATARVWDPATAPELRVVATTEAPARAASFGPGGRTILEAGDDGVARILTADGRVVRELRHPAPVTSAIFTSRGERVLTTDAERTLRVWSADDGTRVATVRGVSAGPVAASADGSLYAVPTGRGAVRILDAATFATVRELRDGGPFAAASFDPGGELIATAGTDGTAAVWNARSGARIRVLEGHTDEVTDVGFSSDGRLLVTASRDRDARVWDVETGRPVLLRGHFGPVFGASFSPDGRFVVTAGPITAGLWQASNGRLITYLRGHEAPLTDASFSPDGTQILTSSRDGTVRSYACEVCGGLDALVRVAEARLAALAAPLSPGDRQRYLAPEAPR